MLRYLRAVSDSVLAEARQRADGYRTTHYRANISLDLVVSAPPPAGEGAAQHAISALEQTARVHTIPVDVWVDAQHLVRRPQMTITVTPAGAQSTGVGLTMDDSDYGPQPRPAVPPADQVEDVGALAASLGGR